jgi:cytochrome oxidase Cu insertion factor (SCO1/SenC/PrrC family)
MSATGTPTKPRSAAPLWILTAIFAAPVIAAWFFYLNPEYRPSGRTNKGELIHPVVSLPPELQLVTPEGKAFDRGPLEGKWTLVYLGGGECDDACVDRLVAIRQIRSALGESQLSVERLLITMDPTAAHLAADLGYKLEGMQVAVTTGAAGGARLLEMLGEGEKALNRTYILDPMGNLMMRYAPDAPPKDTLKDMERLLKASKNWIKGAQYGHK